MLLNFKIYYGGGGGNRTRVREIYSRSQRYMLSSVCFNPIKSTEQTL